MQTKKDTGVKVGFIGLTAIVLSAMVGGGVFDLPASMAREASAGGQIAAWIITGIGVWFIASTFSILSKAVPDLENGIYAYAAKGFGKLAGFFIAYGYWICNCFAQAAYGVLIMATMDFFFPGLFGEGNNVASIIGSSALCWLVFIVIRRGARFGSIINIVGTIGKILPILIFIIAMLSVFQLSVFLEDFWGCTLDGTPLTFSFHSLGAQISNTMLVTLFLFVGIEGAVVMSDKARNQHEVSRATVTGYLVVLALYVLVSLLPLGVYSGADIAGMDNPSMATIMGARFGWVGELIVNAGIIISILSAWLAWIMMLAQMPLFAARDGIFPKAFAKINRHGAPSFSLLVTTIICQVLLILTMFLSGSVWQKMVSVTSVMAMPCYLVCCLFLWKLARSNDWRESGISRRKALVTAVIGAAFAIYLLYASGIDYLMIACLVYAAGTFLFIIGRRQSGFTGSIRAMFTRYEKVLVIVILILGIVGFLHVFSGNLAL